MSACVKDYPKPAPNAELIRQPLLVGRHLIILNNSQHNDGVKLTNRPTPQCLARPLRGVIIAPFQEPLGPQAELGWCESPEAQPTGCFGT